MMRAHKRHLRVGHSGLTLVELIIAITIVGFIAVAAAGLLSTALQTHAYGAGRADLYLEGYRAIERMTATAQDCTYLLIPNAHTPTRTVLACSGFYNDDSDFYFDDPLFPRIDEDVSSDMDEDDANGIDGVDDDGDGSVDEWSYYAQNKDDDEDGDTDEDPLDGVDNDGDGNIDEDCAGDATGDGAAGIRGMDDNADGSIDNASAYDDDEDGTLDEIGLFPVVFFLDSGAGTLRQQAGGTTVDLANHVSAFSVTYEPPNTEHDPRILVSLTLDDGLGETVTLSEYVYPRNIVQRTGKKVHREL